MARSDAAGTDDASDASIDARIRFAVLGVPIDAVDLHSATQRVLDWCADDVGRYVCVRDVHGVLRALDDPALMRVHEESDLVTPDGMPLVWAGREAGHEIGQACGSDLMLSIAQGGVARGVRHFLYGGQQGVADELADVLRTRFPGVQIAGTFCPPFRPLTETERDAHAALINDSGAHIVWVGISTPKQEFWMYAMRPRLHQTALGVGAAFDFHTGRVKRAPDWLRPLGLEWAYRALSEPRRLGRRYAVTVPRFLWLRYLERRRTRAGSR